MELGHGARQDWCVIVADDDLDWRTLLARALRRSGYAVVEAGDGAELTTHCRSLEAAGDYKLVLVSDVDMPGCTGIEAALLLRSMRILVPVLFVTGAPASAIVRVASRIGVREIVGKPVSGDRIVSLVDRIRAGG